MLHKSTVSLLRCSGTECNEGKNDFSLKLSSATRQRLRFSAAQPQFLPLLLASTSSSSSSPSPVYTLMDQALSWSDASAACLAAGQHLASVHSAAENALLLTAAAGNNVWIGGTDAASEGTWVWSPSGTPLSYTNWHSGQPDDYRGNEDCLEFNWGPSGTSGTGKWNDADCSAYKRKYVCERRG